MILAFANERAGVEVAELLGVDERRRICAGGAPTEGIELCFERPGENAI